MIMPDRIPMHPELQYPFRADDDSDGCEVVAANGNFVSYRKEWLAAVLNAYYADPPGRESVPQFVVVNGKHGQGVYRTSDVRHVGKSHDGTFAAFVADMPQPDPNKGAVEISATEYARLKSILAPGQ